MSNEGIRNFFEFFSKLNRPSTPESIPKKEQGKNKLLSRRTFLRLIGFGSAAAALTGCWPDPEPPTNKPADVPAAIPARPETPQKKEISQEQLYHMALRKEAISELVTAVPESLTIKRAFGEWTGTKEQNPMALAVRYADGFADIEITGHENYGGLEVLASNSGNTPQESHSNAQSWGEVFDSSVDSQPKKDLYSKLLSILFSENVPISKEDSDFAVAQIENPANSIQFICSLLIYRNSESIRTVDHQIQTAIRDRLDSAGIKIEEDEWIVSMDPRLYRKDLQGQLDMIRIGKKDAPASRLGSLEDTTRCVLVDWESQTVTTVPSVPKLESISLTPTAQQTLEGNITDLKEEYSFTAGAVPTTMKELLTNLGFLKEGMFIELRFPSNNDDNIVILMRPVPSTIFLRFELVLDPPSSESAMETKAHWRVTGNS